MVVDYRTASSGASDVLDQRVEGYRLQGASYALAVGAATAEPVVRVTFVFLTPAGAIERDLEELDAAVEDVRALVVAGHEMTIDQTAYLAVALDRGH